MSQRAGIWVETRETGGGTDTGYGNDSEKRRAVDGVHFADLFTLVFGGILYYAKAVDLNASK